METTKVLLRKVWALYPPLCKEKVDLNIQVYNTVLQQELTILVRFCCEECQFLPPLSLVILMHPTTLYSYSSVCLPGLEKIAPISAKSADNFTFSHIGGQAVVFWLIIQLLLKMVQPFFALCDSDFCSYACNQWHWQYCFHFLKKYINEPWRIQISVERNVRTWTVGLLGQAHIEPFAACIEYIGSVLNTFCHSN